MIVLHRFAHFGWTLKSLAAKFATITVVLLVFSSTSTVAHENGSSQLSRPVFGSFSAVPANDCPVDAVLCTTGDLTGPLTTYDFVMRTLVPDASDPSKMLYTGESVIETRGGQLLYGQDTGVMFLFPSGTEALFITTVNIVDGTNELENASGKIVAIGILSFVTGESEGIYFGKIRTPGP